MLLYSRYQQTYYFFKNIHFCRLIEPYQSVAMLSLGGIKSFVFAWQASTRREFSARLAVQKQSFLFFFFRF